MNQGVFTFWLATAVLLCGHYEAASEDRSVRPAVSPGTDSTRRVGEEQQLVPTDDWPWWRGPSRNGIAPATTRAPTTWTSQQNVLWRAAVPGRGHSSPIVVGNAVYLATSDEVDQVQSVVAFDRTTGGILWTKEVSRGGFPEEIHSKNTHATSTLAADCERVFVVFFHHESLQATALDAKGNQLWQRRVGYFNPKQYEYGYGASPVIYRSMVIVTGEFDGDSFIAALDRATGNEKWRIKRPRNVSYSTPAIGSVAGRDQLLISGDDQVASYDPLNGNELWTAPGTTAATCGTIVWEGDIVFASGGYPKGETLAVRADGSGEVLWSNRIKCYEQSMLLHAGYLYALDDNGVLHCLKADSGKEMWKERLKGPVSASPVLIGGHIYWANERGTHYVFRPNPEKFELVAENQLGDESFASPAVSRNHLFLRVAENSGGKRQEWLFCVGERSP